MKKNWIEKLELDEKFEMARVRCEVVKYINFSLGVLLFLLFTWYFNVLLFFLFYLVF